MDVACSPAGKCMQADSFAVVFVPRGQKGPSTDTYVVYSMACLEMSNHAWTQSICMYELSLPQAHAHQQALQGPSASGPVENLCQRPTRPHGLTASRPHQSPVTSHHLPRKGRLAESRISFRPGSWIMAVGLSANSGPPLSTFQVGG